MLYKILILLFISSVAFGQFTSDHTGEHIDSVITKVDNSVQWITPEDYGAVGDGITDDTDAIQDVIQAGIDDNKMVLFSKTYKYTISSAFAVDSVAYLGWKFINDSQIDASSSTYGGALFDFAGTRHDDDTLAVDAFKGDKFIVVADAADYSAGDMLMISTQTVRGGSGDKWNGVSTSNKYELAEILTISNDTLNLISHLYDGYTSGASETAVTRITPITGNIEGLDLLGNRIIEFQTGLSIQYANKLNIRDSKIVGTSYVCLLVSTSRDVHVDNFTANDFRYTYEEVNYGVDFDGLQNSSLENSTIFGGRHALTVVATNGVSRNITISNNTFGSQDMFHAALDFHESNQHNIITNNFIYGRTDLRCADFIYQGNINIALSDSTAAGITVRPNGASGLLTFDYVELIDNVVSIPNNKKSKSYALQFSPQGQIYGESVKISGGNYDAYNGINIQQRGDNDEISYIKDIEISDLTIRAEVDTNQIGYSIFLQSTGTNMTWVDNVTLRNLTLISDHRNHLESSLSGNTLIIDNVIFKHIRGQHPAGGEMVNIVAGFKDVYFTNNKMYSEFGGDAQVTITAVNKIRNINNTFYPEKYHTSHSSQKGYKDILTAPIIEDRENEFGFNSNRTMTGAVYHTLDSENGNLIYSATVPTTGTYRNLDRIFNTNLSAGSRLGWILTNTSDRDFTLGTLNGDTITVNTISGGKWFIPEEDTSLYEGATISIVGAFGSGAESTSPSSYIVHLPKGLVSTTVTSSSASGQKVLLVDTTGNFTVGDRIIIDRGTSNEIRTIEGVTLISIILDSALTNTYTNETVENVVVIYDTAAAVSDAVITYYNSGYASTGHGQFGYRTYDGDPSGGGEIYSRLVVTLGTPGWTGITQDSLNLTADTDYTLNFWIYPTDLATVDHIRYEIHDGSEIITNGTEFATGLVLNQWNEVTTSVTVSSSPDIEEDYIRFLQNDGAVGAATTWYLDDVTLRKSDYTDAIENGNMEVDDSHTWLDHNFVTTNERSGAQFHTLDPLFIGEELLNISDSTWYKSTTTAAAGWKATQ